MRCGAGTPVDDLDAALAEVGQCVALATRRHGRRGALGRAQRHPPTGLRTRPRRVAAGLLRLGRRRGRAGRRADGEERQRLRSVPAAGRSSWHAWVSRRRDHPAHSAPTSSTRNGSPSRPTTRSRRSPASTDRHRCCGTAHELWALLEGHPDDVAAQAAALVVDSLRRPAGTADRVSRRVVAPAAVGIADRPVRRRGRRRRRAPCRNRHRARRRSRSESSVTKLTRRIKAEFDPSGRLNPGVGLG